MKIKVADPTGFCFGVKRAIDALVKALSEYGRVYAFGSPIHNSEEIKRLSKMGLVVIERVEDIPENSVVFVRAHGVSPVIMEQIKERAGIVIDGTCPFVRKVQCRALELSKQGYFVVVLGDKGHPEVKGIIGHIKNDKFVVVSSPSEIEVDKISSFDRIGVVSQTTQKIFKFKELVAELIEHVDEVRVYNTICSATFARQKAVRELATNVDGVLIVGNHDSANTQKLVEIVKLCGCDVMHVENIDEIKRGWFKGKEVIGIAGGASTPDWLINQVIKQVQRIAE